jgi:integrase
MAFPQCSHITRKRGVYYFRQRLPAPGMGEVAISLHTRNFREAEHLATELSLASNRLFSVVMYDRAKVAAVLRAERLKMMDIARRRVLASAYGLADGHERHERDRKTLEDVRVLKNAIGLQEDALRTRDLRGPEPVIRRLMVENNIPEEAFAEMGLGFLQATVESMKQRQRWMEKGLFDFEAEEQVSNEAPAASVTKSSSSAPVRLMLSAAMSSYVSLMEGTASWRGQTLAQNQTTYRMFLDHCGDKLVTEYGKRDTSSFFDVLRRLPSLYSKSSEWRGLTLAEIAEKTDGQALPRLAMKTIKRHFSALGGLFDHLRRRGDYVAENPAHGFSFPMGKVRVNQGREMWEGEELTKLFSSPVWAGCSSPARRSTPGTLVIKDEKFWLPLLGLYHGNRLEEFAQLHLSDVRQVDGIWCLDINDEEAKQIKNAQSERLVPLHPELKRLGFLDYVSDIAPAKSARIFPQLAPGGPDSKLGYYFTKWWSRYRRDVGVYRKGLDYHSFRHGVTTKLFAAGVSETVIDTLTGHTGGSTSRRVYLKKLPVTLLFDAIQKVVWNEVTLSVEEVG